MIFKLILVSSKSTDLKYNKPDFMLSMNQIPAIGRDVFDNKPKTTPEVHDKNDHPFKERDPGLMDFESQSKNHTHPKPDIFINNIPLEHNEPSRGLKLRSSSHINHQPKPDIFINREGKATISTRIN